MPIDTSVFCEMEDSNTTKFNGEGWGGGYWCTGEIEDLYWPNEPRLIRSTVSDAGDAELQQVALIGGSASAAAAQGGVSALQILAVGATAAVGGFFAIRAFRNHKREHGL